jgi:hypothetical protein
MGVHHGRADLLGRFDEDTDTITAAPSLENKC